MASEVMPAPMTMAVPQPQTAREISAAYSAAQAQAEVQTRAVIARHNPRSLDDFQANALHLCKDPDFADIALYKRKVGRKKNDAGQWEDSFAIDFSIRFIEAVIPYFKNIYSRMRVVEETEDHITINVAVYDAESNTGHDQDVSLPKLVERTDIQDREPVSQRLNSNNKTVYTVRATKDELRNVIGAERSKLTRDQAKKLMPFHILAKCRKQIEQTVADENANDPEAVKTRVIDSFSALGVKPSQLAEYLDRSLDSLQPKDLAELRVLHNGLKEGEFLWSDLVRAKAAPAEGETDPAAAEKPVNKIKQKIAEARAKAGTKPGDAAKQGELPPDQGTK
jgi:hypothetical protein